MTILVTGGAGFIGSHTCVELLNNGYDVIVVDNFYNSCMTAVDRVEEITGRKILFYEADLKDRDALDKIFSDNKIDAVIHFAGYKAVGESVSKPIEYYYNNISGTLILTDVMRNHGVKSIVFSSSATVYGDPDILPITEECKVGGVTNPYGQTKLMLEQILTDIYVSDNEWNVILLRYFNPIGAHESGRIGEDPNGIPNNLVPYVSQVAVGKLEKINVFGDDYDTPDGTGMRDYIHVVDLAKGHVKALEKLWEMKASKGSDDSDGSKGSKGKAAGKDGKAAGKDDRAAGNDDKAAGEDDRAAGKDDKAAGEDDKAAGNDDKAAGEDNRAAGVKVYNLGTGQGTSVLEIIHAYEKASGKKLPYVVGPRRPGDIAACYADCTKAEKELGWKAEYGIERMCEDAYRWQSMNPNGYK